MKKYQNLIKKVLNTGTMQQNRTGVEAISTPGEMLKFDLRDSFPAVTTKKLAFKMVKGELIGFMRGYQNAEDFRGLGCKIWDQNANENEAWLRNPNRKGIDDLGRIYGAQWISWRKADGTEINQLAVAVDTILKDPTNRRIIVNAWRPDEFDQMALPPCHVLYQFIVNVKENTLNLCMYQRSCDVFLGVPFNIASASLLLSIVARLTGYTPGVFTHFLADTHIYKNHIDQCNQVLARKPFESPGLVIDNSVMKLHKTCNEKAIVTAINKIEPDDISLLGYRSHEAIKADMAV
jgi:thymidylate synthase